ncbi:DUF5361 domain-containing protein [Mycobacteroides abscessus]|uniref:DUF5361 domain-containing protein n=1 Tax=Mycobacteroides abscessus TaxID=36809 RepID=UPI00092A14EC|nr:Uncharacterised protein [Mycobacteroides abscessus subsp. bolletii]SHW62545.1 Uncharacterised protein [Mycobacteroides abscessus subsp. bolletii]SHW90532.1 Uncharacterised protein [Mycobacteroides abscessus subsp. bolletii]SHX34974.1 Uncharacterised protein [Mycobacteroides abscessus subsp. bolletii]SKV80307.1 Uncharacterised protein [Mycobacteroides abscessus subsp. bolletii]
MTVVRLPADSELVREKWPERTKAAAWDLKAQLLAYLADIGNLWVWSNTDDGRAGINPPDPVGIDDGRPGVKPRTKRHKPKATPLSEYKRQRGDIYAQPNRAMRLSELFS